MSIKNVLYAKDPYERKYRYLIKGVRGWPEGTFIKRILLNTLVLCRMSAEE